MSFKNATKGGRSVSVLKPVFECFASCPRGLEVLLQNEIEKLGASKVVTTYGGCTFEASWIQATRITYWSRFAGRVGLQIAKGPFLVDEDLYKLALTVPWWNWFGLSQTFRVDLNNLGANVKSIRFTQLRLKDAICDAFIRQFDERPNISIDAPDVRVFGAVSATEAMIYIDLAGENLFKRGWRQDKGEAPLKENLAAGIWAFAKQRAEAIGATHFMDPFCGSGTLVIESVCELCDRAPGLERPFGFERLKPYDPALGQALQNEANQRFNAGLDKALETRHFQWEASDITPLLVEMAQENARRAGLGELMDAGLIKFSQKDALVTKPTAELGLLLTNPPYGERVRAKGADIPEDEAYIRLFKELGNLLKSSYSGWTAMIFSGDLEIKKAIGLSPKRKTPLFNGAIECRLFEFPIAAGSYRPRAEGN